MYIIVTQKFIILKIFKMKMTLLIKWKMSFAHTSIKYIKNMQKLKQFKDIKIDLQTIFLYQYYHQLSSIRSFFCCFCQNVSHGANQFFHIRNMQKFIWSMSIGSRSKHPSNKKLCFGPKFFQKSHERDWASFR